MSNTSNAYQMFSPEQVTRSNEPKQRRRSISINLHETATPAVKSLPSLEANDLSSHHPLLGHPENADLQSAYDKLTIWKRTIEKHLNRAYLQKLKEIDELLSEGHNNIDLIFGTIPIFEQLAIVTSRPPPIDYTYDDIELNYDKSSAFDLNSNNILLCASDRQVLVYDHVKFQLILYDQNSCQGSFNWDSNEYGEPCELTYSSYLDLFCIITNRGLFTWSSDQSESPNFIEQIKPVAKNRLWSIASTDKRPDVFVLFKLGSYVERWNSDLDNRSWQQIQRWSNHDLFERNDQRIRTIRMTSAYVAWTVETMTTFRWRVDLLDYHLQILRSGIEIDHIDRASSCLLSNLASEQFLIIDSNCHLLCVLDSQGSIRMKNDHLTKKRIKNAVIMKQIEQSWLVIRLEQPNQLHFIALSNSQ